MFNFYSLKQIKIATIKFYFCYNILIFTKFKFNNFTKLKIMYFEIEHKQASIFYLINKQKSSSK